MREGAECIFILHLVRSRTSTLSRALVGSLQLTTARLQSKLRREKEGWSEQLADAERALLASQRECSDRQARLNGEHFILFLQYLVTLTLHFRSLLSD